MKNLLQSIKRILRSAINGLKFFFVTIPPFFKTKKFFILLFLFLWFFLFTPISLHQFGQKVESFIKRKAKEGVQTFEKQTGLSIQWERLDFNILTATVKLQGVQFRSYGKNSPFSFLDGLQKIKQISASPSFYSLLFKKKIILSKLKIQEGNIYLKNIRLKNPNPAENSSMVLPIRKIIIKNTDLYIKHKNQNFMFFKARLKIFQTKKRAFHFDLLVPEVFIQAMEKKTDKKLKFSIDTKSFIQHNRDAKTFSNLPQTLSGYAPKNKPLGNLDKKSLAGTQNNPSLSVTTSNRVSLSEKKHKTNISPVTSRQNTSSILAPAFDKEILDAQALKTKADRVFQLSLNGLMQSNAFFLKDIHLKNKHFSSWTDWLDIYFDSKNIKQINIKSSGSAPFFLLQNALFLVKSKENLKILQNILYKIITQKASFDFLSYKLNLEYRRKKGYQGFFDLENKSYTLPLLQKFSLKGKLLNYILTIDHGFLKTHTKGAIYIKKVKWIFKEKPFQLQVLAHLDNLSLDIFKELKNSDFPLQGDFTGSIYCEKTHGVQCEVQTRSQKIDLKLKNKPIISLYSMDLHSNINWSSDQILTMDIQASKIKTTALVKNEDMEHKKQNSKISSKSEDESNTGFVKNKNPASLQFKGQYITLKQKLQAEYFFKGNLYKDIHFYIPFVLKGGINTLKGKLMVEKSNFNLSGEFSSSNLQIKSYSLTQVSGLYRLQNKRLQFFDIKGGRLDRTYYEARLDIDFEQDRLVLHTQFPFLDLEDVAYAVKKTHPDLANLKGTGSASFFVHFPWKKVKNHAFHLKAQLFNVFAGKDFFQQAIFDLQLQKQKGMVKTLFLKKGQGFIKATGTFDSAYRLKLRLMGEKIPLERLEAMHGFLPFNQSGDLQFNLKIDGEIKNPDVKGDLLISNMLLYSYPVPDSHLKLRMDRFALWISGNIMNEIEVERLIYPFLSAHSKNIFRPGIEIKGRLKSLNFVRLILAKNKIESTKHYSSKLDGKFFFAQNSNFQSEVKKKNKLKKDFFFNRFVSFPKSLENWKGFVKVSLLSISKANKWMKSDKDFFLYLKQKKWSISSVRFSHHDKSFFSIEPKQKGRLLLSGGSSLNLFSVFFPFLEDIEGNIKGKILVEGDLLQPTARGHMQIQKGFFSLKPLPGISDINTSVVVSKNNIFINNFKGFVGGGVLKGGGSVFYDFISAPHLNLNFNFANVRFNLPKDFKTKGQGELSITGKKSPYMISGQYDVHSGIIHKDFLAANKEIKYNFSFLKEEKTKQDSLFHLQLNIQTKNPVLINSPLIKSSVKGYADIYGPVESFLMHGDFILASEKEKENLIFFRGHEFKIRFGSIIFNQSEPDEPYLNIQADTLVKTRDPQEENTERTHKIFLSLKGSAKEPQVVLKSSPLLSEKKIISLLTLGVTPKHFDAKVEHDVSSYSYQFLALLVEKSLNREIKNTLGLDFRLTPYINELNKPVTKVTLSRNWFNKWKSSFSRTLETSKSDMRIKYNLSQKTSLTAFWENHIDLDTKQKESLGMDLEFAFDF